MFPKFDEAEPLASKFWSLGGARHPSHRSSKAAAANLRCTLPLVARRMSAGSISVQVMSWWMFPQMIRTLWSREILSPTTFSILKPDAYQ